MGSRTTCDHGDTEVIHEGDRCPLCEILRDLAREKQGLTQAFLKHGLVGVHVNPDMLGILLPPGLAVPGEPVMLEIGLDTVIPIPDLEITECGISCTLSFSRQPFKVVLPWTSVFAITKPDGTGAVWQSSMPEKLRQKVDIRAGELVGDPGEMGGEEVTHREQGRKVGAFSVIDGGRDGE